MMEQNKEYFVFISYKSEDVEWAVWLQHELEHYHLPASYNGRTDVRKKLRPIFRDIDELSAGNLPDQIKKALNNSKNLIVICSPKAAESQWVNQEVETFISLGRVKNIFPFIVEGNSPKEFFPPSLLKLPKSEERLGGDVSKSGRDAAFVKVVSGILDVEFDSLWNRYEREKAEKERKAREERDKLLVIQSRFLAEKACELLNEGNSYTARKLVLKSLPMNLTKPERPYVPEAEFAMRMVDDNEDCILRGHPKTVNFAIFSPNGKYIATASMDNTIRIWNEYTGQCLKTLIGHTGNVNSVAFSPNCKLIVSASEDETLRIWDASVGKCLKILQGHTGSVKSVFFSSDGKCIVSASTDGTIRIWDSAKGGCLCIMHGHESIVVCSIFSPDNKYIASASWDKSIRIWARVTGKCIHVLQGHEDIVCSVSYSPDGKYIASASWDKSIRIWERSTGKCIHVLQGHSDVVNSSSFSHDGNFLVTASHDKTIRIWNFPSLQDLINKTLERFKDNPLTPEERKKYYLD